MTDVGDQQATQESGAELRLHGVSQVGFERGQLGFLKIPDGSAAADKNDPIAELSCVALPLCGELLLAVAVDQGVEREGEFEAISLEPFIHSCRFDQRNWNHVFAERELNQFVLGGRQIELVEGVALV